MPAQYSTHKLPWTTGEAAALEELGGAPPQVVNVLVDAAGWAHRFPGLRAWPAGPPTPQVPVTADQTIIGMTDWRNFLVGVTADRRLWAADGMGGVVALSDATPATQLDGSARPIFARGTNILAIAGGGEIQKWTGAGLASRLGGTPPMASHVCDIAQRLVAADLGNSGLMHWTNVGEGTWETTWLALNYAEAEARPDPIVALHETSNELFAFGTQTLQVFSPDPTAIFAPQVTQNVGCLAPYSIIPIWEQKAFAFIDHRRRIQRSNGRDIEELTGPQMHKIIEGIDTIADCWAFQAHVGSFDLLVWVFPTDGRAFVYEQNTKQWSELRSYENTWLPWRGKAYHYWPDKNLELVGLVAQVAEFTEEAQDELGHPIRSFVRTGFIDHDTEQPKQSIILRMPVRRGQGAFGAAAPVLDLAWRDDLGPFCAPLHLSLGAAGDYSTQIERRIIGRPYRRRQWELSLSGAVGTTFGAPEETIEALET